MASLFNPHHEDVLRRIREDMRQNRWPAAVVTLPSDEWLIYCSQMGVNPAHDHARHFTSAYAMEVMKGPEYSIRQYADYYLFERGGR